MSWIHYLPDNRKKEISAKQTILDASLQAQIPHAHACGGKGRCSTCRVTVVEGLDHCRPRTVLETQLARRLHLSDEVRLACQTSIRGNITVRRHLLDQQDVKISAGITQSDGPTSLGEERTVAILFADIRNFTTFAESHPPYDAIYVLNRYFHEVNLVIQKHGGHVDNYMGDGLMALFGVDQSRNAALRAVRAGLGMLRTMARLSRFLKSIYQTPLEIGVGIHFGDVIMGSIGSDQNKRMTVIGDTVNMASRVESATKTCGASFLISEETYREVRNQVRVKQKHASIQLKGKSGRHNLFEIAGLRMQRTR